MPTTWTWYSAGPGGPLQQDPSHQGIVTQSIRVTWTKTTRHFSMSWQLCSWEFRKEGGEVEEKAHFEERVWNLAWCGKL